MGTYEYEVVVHEKKDEDGKVVRAAERVAHDEGVIRKPTRENLLMQYVELLRRIGAKAEEVSVNIRPFL